MSYHSGNQLVDPHMLFDKLPLQPGMHVADFGCGRTGHIVFPAALIVGERGLIFAVDILKDVLDNIQKRAKIESLHQIQTIWSNIEYVGKTAIPDESLDVVFIVNVLSQSDNRHGVLEEAKRLLKKKGRIVVVDWNKQGLSFCPDHTRFVNFDDVIQWGRVQGFGVQEECIVGPYHRGVILYRNS